MGKPTAIAQGGLKHAGDLAYRSAQMQLYSDVLRENFNITPWLMIVPALTVLMIWKRIPGFLRETRVRHSSS